jgi:hypothetical protein
MQAWRRQPIAKQGLAVMNPKMQEFVILKDFILQHHHDSLNFCQV